ncbi:hypothetical protein TARUN_9874 [Trichoderma arundinaceum]|uniref:Uncharacterized protein n=1 Tax=Trichoderma arundinaceum TaxID=490622 RepID=A0A395N8E8_TRIAR|nr:hypothetical protein TARUN_9874 [Trichoderma arundinaceum]
MRAALLQEQWNLNFGYDYRETDVVHHSFTRLLMDEDPEDTEESLVIKRPTILRFHMKQRHLCEKISMKFRWGPEASYRRLLSNSES